MLYDSRKNLESDAGCHGSSLEKCLNRRPMTVMLGACGEAEYREFLLRNDVGDIDGRASICSREADGVFCIVRVIL